MVNADITTKWGGGTPVDALNINRYYLNMVTFKDNLRKIAADLNSDNKINPLDALLVNRRYIKGINSFKPGDWVFIPEIIVVDGSSVSKNFKTICYGDVDGSYKP